MLNKGGTEDNDLCLSYVLCRLISEIFHATLLLRIVSVDIVVPVVWANFNREKDRDRPVYHVYMKKTYRNTARGSTQDATQKAKKEDNLEQ